MSFIAKTEEEAYKHKEIIASLSSDSQPEDYTIYFIKCKICGFVKQMIGYTNKRRRARKHYCPNCKITAPINYM